MDRKEKSIKINYILNTIRTILAIVFPIITYPYSCRILMPDGIGKVAFANSVIAYFVMLSSIGIPLYGIRECAKVRNDKTLLSKLTHEIFFINIVSTVISYGMFLLLLFWSNGVYAEKELFILLSSTIIFTTLGIEWLYQGLEEYVYITLRSIIFQLISIVILFTMVKAKNDYLIYAAIGVLSSVGSGILNFIHSRKLINYKYYGGYNIKRHIKPIFTMFAMALVGSIYVNLDSVMLGKMSDMTAVGLYSAAVKLNKTALTVVTSIGVVLMPRISYYIENKMKEKFAFLVSKSLDFSTMLVLPIMTGLFLLSDEIILLFSGQKFIAASLAIKIMVPIILFISLSHLTGVQLLIPLGREKYTLYSFIVGAIINFTLNILLIPVYAQNGAAVSTTITEFSVALIQVFFVWDIIKENIFTRDKFLFLVASILIGIEIICFKAFIPGNIGRVSVSVVICSITYFLILIALKSPIMLELLSRVKIKKERPLQ